MNLASLTTLSILALAPTITRPEPNRIVVDGVQYAGLTPEAEVITGQEIMYGFAFGDGEPIEFRIDPLVVYEVYAFENGDGSVQSSGPTRDVVIEHVLENYIVSRAAFSEWESQFDQITLGTHPLVDGAVSYFEIGEAAIRVHQRLGGARRD